MSQSMNHLPVFQIALHAPEEIDLVRHYAKRVAALAGLSVFDQARLATSLAEIGANAVHHAGGGTVKFSIARRGKRQYVQAVVIDHGPGIADLEHLLDTSASAAASSGAESGIAVARKLVDRFSLESRPNVGTIATVAKLIPVHQPLVTDEIAAQWAGALAEESPASVAAAAPAQQSRELYEALAELRLTERTLKRQLRKVEQLNEKLDVLSLVASNTDHSVVITDRNGLIEWVNDGFSRITGYEPFEVVGKKPGHLLQGPLTDPETVARIRAGLRSGESFTEEILNYHKDGYTYWVAMNIFPVFDKRGNIVRYMAIQNDVTHHRRAEEELQSAKEAAERANRAKSELLANMSHEIRTPMNAVIGMTDLVLDSELTVDQRDCLTIVKESAHSLLRLLGDILDFSKIEAGKLELDRVSFDVRATVALTMRVLALPAHEKGLELACDVAADVPEQVVGDPARWRQILINLVGNAIKFTPTGEVVVRIEAEPRPGEMTLLHGSVRDTGIGVPADKQQLIFKSFAQADSSMTRRFGGTGLGLAITSQLVGMMGGQVWVESRAGSGSTFHFTTLLQTGLAGTAASERQKIAEALHGVQVLVVDDNASSREIIHGKLTRLGAEATAAANADTALAVLRERASASRPVDVVVIDAEMPETDGFALVERIKADKSLSPALIMMLSTVHRESDVKCCRELGIGAYLTKPVVLSDLAETLFAALGLKPSPLTVSAPRETAQKASRSLNVLVAEDTPANQQLVIRILEKRGHRHVVAADGRQALELYQLQPFDCILMDVQMPEIDGLRVTHMIRELERGSGRRTPIIAMTAHAMKGNRETCLAAGMDAYVAKPLDAKELIALVEGVAVPPAAAVAPTVIPLKASPDGYDFEPALRRLDHDWELFDQLAQFFSQDAPGLLNEMRAAIEAGDGATLQRAAHSLKGLIRNFDAGRASQAASRLEARGRDAELDGAADDLQKLEAGVERLLDALREYRPEAFVSRSAAL
jgi:two-component system, sensor histidine kinase and response regulator